jgi:ribosomal protein S18 acetylase RimI-like enzyme
MSVTVRFYEHGDADSVLQIYRSVGTWFEDVDVTKDFIVSSSERPDFRFIVAEDSGKVVGFIGALYFTVVGRAELGPIGVREADRSQGVGSMLCDAMLAFLKKNGVRRVVVKVKAENKAALSFFLRKGFSHGAYLRRYTLKGEDAIELVSRL